VEVYFIAPNLHPITYREQAKSSPGVNENQVPCNLPGENRECNLNIKLQVEPAKKVKTLNYWKY